MGMGWKYFFLKKHVWLGHPNGHIVMDSTMGVGRPVLCPDVSSCRLVLPVRLNAELASEANLVV